MKNKVDDQQLPRVVRGEEPDIGMYGQEIRPRLVTRIKASDQLNQMEGVYITKVEAKAVQVVELVIVTTPDIVDGKLVEGTADIVPVG